MAIDKSKILKSAEKYIASGKVAPAIEEYLKILKENPKDWNLMIQIGDLYLKINKNSEAIQYFQKVADHYNADGFFLKAIAIYKRINKLEPNLTDVCMKLADLYLKQGLTMDAKTQLQVVAQHYMSKNQTREAIHTLKKLIEIEPDNLRSRNDLAKAYKNEGMLAEAVQEYMDISDELTRKNLLKESLTVLETAFKLDSRNTAILRKILAVYSEQNEMGKAMALLEDALKADRSNAQVLALLAETYASKNQFDRAHQTIDQAIQNTTDKEQFWVTKGDLYLKENDLISAFEQYEQVVDRMGRRKEYDKAVTLLQKVTNADASFHPALQKMLNLYTSLRQESNVVSTYNSLVDAYISKTMYPEAAESLEKLISLEPDNAQHQEKLEFVQSFLEKPAKASESRKASVSGPVPTPEIEPEMPANDFDMDINLDLGQLSAPVAEPSSPPAPEPAVPRKAERAYDKHAPSVSKQPSVASPSAAAQESEEEKEFVSEHLIEAEVFTKYGLIDKAIEQLQIITAKYSNSVLAHQKLKEIYLEKGDRDRAVEECVVMSRIFRKQGDLDQAEDLLSEARQINPNHPSLDRAYKEMPGVAAPAPVAAPTTAKPVPPPAKPPAPPPAGSGRKDLLSEIEKLAHGVKKAPAKPAPSKPTPPPASVEAVPPPPDIVVEIEEPIEAQQGPLGADQFEEIDFYTSQGLMSEAHRLLMDLKEKHPDDPGILSRLSMFEEVPVSSEDLEVDVEIPIPEQSPTPPELMNPEIGLEEQEEVSEHLPANEIVAFSDESSEGLEDLKLGVPGEGTEEPVVEEQPLEEIPAVEESSIEFSLEVTPEVESISEVPSDMEESVEGMDFSPAFEESAAASPQEPELVLEPEIVEPEAAEPEQPSEPEPEAPSEEGLAQTMDLSDFGELSVPQELVEEAQAEPEPAPPEIVGNPFEGRVSEEPTSDVTPAGSVEFGEAVEIAEHVVESSEGKADELDFPAERSLDDALDAAFQDEEADEESKPVQASQELFEEEEDFFDLAAELEEGFLNVQDAVAEERPADGQNYSIEEILTDFKKGVEKQLGSEDYDTRYNLGIAYKEMGLVDEAIAEFQIASKDEKRFLECCSMLGLCFVEKGMPKLALKWYQRGLETQGYSEEEYLGLRFEMAQAYEAMGEEDKALECYQDVYGANASYRNVSKKINELQQSLKKK